MLTLTPINLKTANAFVQQYHRHHKPTRGHKVSIGVSEDGALVGGAVCGRPVARRLDDGYTLEVNRLCTDGTPNACSILYAAAYRAARAMGYNKVITYILDTENGSSLKAAGYVCEGKAGGLEWNGAKAPKQTDRYGIELKGWNVTVIAAIVALSFKESDWKIYACALVLNVVFWFLDAYYLKQEKLFRELYDKVSKISDDNLVDFSMNTSEFKEKVSAIPCLMIKNISITPLYLSISAVLIFLIHIV